MRENIKKYTDFTTINEKGFFDKKEKEKDFHIKFGLDKFITDFFSGLDSPIIMSMLYRMLDTDKFIKFGEEIYSFTPEEKEKLEKIKPLFDELVSTVAKIKDIQATKNN